MGKRGGGAFGEVLAAFKGDVYDLWRASGVSTTALYQAKKREDVKILRADACLKLARAWAKHTNAKPADELTMARRLAGLG